MGRLCINGLDEGVPSGDQIGQSSCRLGGPILLLGWGLDRVGFPGQQNLVTSSGHWNSKTNGPSHRQIQFWTQGMGDAVKSEDCKHLAFGLQSGKKTMH